MKRAAIYARVSTSDQADNGTSLESQVGACQKYADENGYAVVATFKESGSGASLERPLLSQVREMVRKGGIEAVIFYALDRLSRDETDTLILAREWRLAGVELKCATVPIEDSAQGQFLLTLLAAVGKLERASILERTMRGKRQTVRNGKILRTSFDMFGYRYEDGTYHIYEPEALWVQRIFHWYCVEGISLLAVAYRLLNAGVPSKQGGKWASATVRNILSNEAYTGEYYWGKRTGTMNSRRLRPRSEWIGPINIPPVISRDLFEAAQQQVQYNKINSRRRCKSQYLLRGMLTCDHCGRRLAGDKAVRRTGTYTYYVCTNKLAATQPEDRCKMPRINGRLAEEKVWEWALSQITDPNMIERVLDASGSMDREQRERDDADMRSLIGLKLELEREENKLIELFTREGITFDKYIEHSALLKDRRQSIDKDIEEIEARTAAWETTRGNIEAAVKIVQTVQQTLPSVLVEVGFDEKREILEALHVTGTALPNGDLLIRGLISEDLLTLARPAREEVRSHDLHSDRRSNWSRQDLADEAGEREVRYASRAGGDRRGRYGQSKAYS